MAEIKWYANQLSQNVYNQCARAIGKACVLVEREAKRTMSKDPKTGRIYRKPYTKHAKWQASAPGESPAVVTNTLKGSITHEVFTDGADIVGRVGTNVEYARILELGGSKIAARPYLAPSLFKMRKAVKELLALSGL